MKSELATQMLPWLSEALPIGRLSWVFPLESLGGMTPITLPSGPMTASALFREPVTQALPCASIARPKGFIAEVDPESGGIGTANALSGRPFG